jgi:hypothetical protein
MPACGGICPLASDIGISTSTPISDTVRASTSRGRGGHVAAGWVGTGDLDGYSITVEEA